MKNNIRNKIVDTARALNNYLDKIYLDDRNVMKILLSFMIAGYITFFLQIVIENNLFLNIKKFKIIIMSTPMIRSNILSTIIFLISLLLTIMIPVIAMLYMVEKRLLYINIPLIIFDLIFIALSIVKGEIHSIVLIVWYLSISIYIYSIIDLLGRIYAWLSSSEDSIQLDIGKATLIWTIIAFFLGMFFRR